ncbi:HI1506-related protein [Mesorhizobium sp. M0106]|uniref:HI1506-related protein n=1 Tax=Mesorhizobium sp. M0106 TaxID=2956880 RepID=UPI003337F90D
MAKAPRTRNAKSVVADQNIAANASPEAGATILAPAAPSLGAATENSSTIQESVTASAASPTTVATTNAAVEPSGRAVVEHAPDAPSPQAAGTISPDNPPESEGQGGAGNGAGSAESLPQFLANDEFNGPGGDPDEMDYGTLKDLDTRLGTAENEFRSKFPRMAAAIDTWQAANADGDVPSGVRIRSKLDGFRRAGIAHSKAPVEHAMEAFKGPEQLEALFAEPNLVVELI